MFFLGRWRNSTFNWMQCPTAPLTFEAIVSMESLRCLKLSLPFLDAKELGISEVSSTAVQLSVQRSDLWETLCDSYSQRTLESHRGEDVYWPDRDEDTAKDYAQRLYELPGFAKTIDFFQREIHLGLSTGNMLTYFVLWDPERSESKSQVGEVRCRPRCSKMPEM